MSDMERLELYEKLEKAEGRIVALEKQVCCTVVVKTSLQGHWEYLQLFEELIDNRNCFRVLEGNVINKN